MKASEVTPTVMVLWTLGVIATLACFGAVGVILALGI